MKHEKEGRNVGNLERLHCEHVVLHAIPISDHSKLYIIFIIYVWSFRYIIGLGSDKYFLDEIIRKL